MTDTIRIMPRQPIEARLVDGDCAYFWVDSGGVERAGTPSDWVEVSDPIVWDGTDESFAAIAVALPIGSRVGRSPTNNKLPMHIYLGCGDPVRVPVGWRIQPFSDSFAILPPEVTP